MLETSNEWAGSFDPESYAAARSVLERDRERAQGEAKAALSKRLRLVAIVAVAWAACTVAMAFVNGDLLLVAEIGWVAIVVWGVYYLIPALFGRGNLDEVFDQYEARLAELEEAQAPFPPVADTGDLAAALDLVDLPRS